MKQVKEKLTGVDPYFTKLSDAMVTWIEAWTEINSGSSKTAVANGTPKVSKSK
jgi:reversibly glycosylated polypeptide/UDP-arabinopyranose mutase